MSSMRPLPTVIGPTENALRALLARALSSTLIPGYSAWVVLNAVNAAGPGYNWRERTADGLKASPDDLEVVLDKLRSAGLVDGGEVLTARGAEELTAARAAVTEATRGLVEGIDEAQQETTRQVLDAIRRKAERLLSA
ncbi:hypothetical protein HJ590_15075 [Naumannella sp. ID2617S]|nr:hypothetical protein [Naumannella sp. ID2617S]